ncbi:MAG: type I glyceraldehyde-3-phosphate dehydrogenase [Candidatus Fermentibacter sp.]|nr:type I glyceraldehyde-3-phosphate dehydrogenase [Candidatus Fermentibacter sp.]
MRVAINGFGRIGRLVCRRAAGIGGIEIVAVNDVTDPATLAHLLKYDSVHGRFRGEVAVEGDSIRAGGSSFRVLSVKDPAALPWKDMGVDIVVEATGLFTARDKAAAHLSAGARRVLVSAPAKGADLTAVMGVNNHRYDPASHFVVSTASCTTNCLAPVAKVLNDSFGIVTGLMTTIHAYTNDQRILDLPHKDRRRARAAAVNVIPTTTGAAAAIGEVIPELKGRLDGFAVRVPVPDGSLVDLTCRLENPVTVESVNEAMRAAASGPLSGVLEYSTEPLVSSDIVGNPASSVFDSEFTRVVGEKTVKVISWYDNEWGYSCRMVDMLKHMGEAGL